MDCGGKYFVSAAYEALQFIKSGLVEICLAKSTDTQASILFYFMANREEEAFDKR